MKIKLISPKVTMRLMDSHWKSHMSPPLALLVVGALTPRQHEVWLEDENVEKLQLDDEPDLVGITVKADTFYRANEIACWYHAKGVRVVMGGIHATVCPDDCLTCADTVVIGEAEMVWHDLLLDCEKGRLARVYRAVGESDIARSPIPRWDLLKGKNYLFTNTLTIGRGCPWRCDFCYNSSRNVDARYRMKPLGTILSEIQSLGIRHVMFIDDNFIGDPRRVRSVLDTFQEMQLTWHAAVSADIGYHDDLLDRMAESGCKTLFIGFESVNQSNLLHCHKRQNRIAEYDETIRKIHQRGMMVNASIVFGFDGDDESVFPLTLEWLIRNRVETMTAHILTPYPGTKLHARLETEGRLIDKDLRHYNTSRAVFQPLLMTPEQLQSGYFKIYRDFYSFGNILRRKPVSEGQLIPYLMFNLIYRKWGKVFSQLGMFVGMRRLAVLAKAVSYPSRVAQHIFAAVFHRPVAREMAGR